MSRGAAIALGCVLASSCGERVPLAARGLSLRVQTHDEGVESGKVFSLTVVRTWNEELVPEPWSDHVLAPLVVRAEATETEQRRGNGFVEETRRLQCFAFSLEDVHLPAIAFKAAPRDGSKVKVAYSDALELRVKPSLDPNAPGSVELPSDLLEAPFPWRRTALAGALAVVLLAILASAARRRAPPAIERPAAPPTLSPRARALQRLQRLREHRLDGVEAIEAYYVETSASIRHYVQERYAMRAPDMTTEELLASRDGERMLKPVHRASLSGLLQSCDLVKFARLVPARPEHERILQTAVSFVEETSDATEQSS